MRTPLVLVLFAVVVIVFFADILLGDRVLMSYNPAQDDPWHHYADQEQLEARTYRPDALLAYLPRTTELSRSIMAGRLPLWNPYAFCGTPFFADPQSRVLYPVSLLLVPFNPLRAMGYDMAIHFFLAMVGMYLFLRIVGTSTAGSVLGGLAYGFSSFFYTRMGHPTFVASAAWIPFMFYGYELARRRERLGTLALAGFLVMGYLAGFPQVFLFGVTALVLYAAWISVEEAVRHNRFEIIRSVRILSIAGIISALIASMQLVPFGEFLRNSAGLGYTFEAMKRVYLWNPVLLIRGIVPNFFGNPAEGTSWLILIKKAVSHENQGFFVYCGAGCFILKCGGLSLLGESRRVRVLFAMLFASIGLATWPAVLRIAYAVIPFVSYSQIDRVSVLSCFAISALCGITLSKVSGSDDPRLRRRFSRVILVTAIIILALLLGAIAMRGPAAEAFTKEISRFPTSAWDKAGYSRIGEWLDGTGNAWAAFETREVARAVAFVLLAASILLLIASRGPRSRRTAGILAALFILCGLSDLTVTARGYYITRPPDTLRETEGVTFLREASGRPGGWRTARYPSNSRVLLPSTGQIFGVPSLRGRATMTPQAHADFLGVVSGSGKERASAGRKRQRLTAEAFDLACVRFLLSSHRDPRISLRDHVLVYDSDMRIHENRQALPKGVCLRKAAAEGLGTSEGSAEGVIEVYRALRDPEVNLCGTTSIRSYEPERIAMEVDADEACYLVFQDTYYPGWKAYVDGAEMPIIKTDLGFRAIELSAGRSDVIMEYRPASLRIGFLLGGLGVVAALLYAWKARFGGGEPQTGS
jgi:hypothetical protein